MASFWFLLAPPLIIMAFMASPSLSFSSSKKLQNTPPIATTIATISAAPALLPNPPLSSPFTELSPDISPLLPSPGGELPSPTGSSIPTIPSNPSPPNPDETLGLGPDSALVSPSRSNKLTSTGACLDLFRFVNFSVLVGLMLF
ncbi:hypothetical protein HYC85_019346 [Camellia sinensis]|uniref:Classical arabinogalactan protein 26 n=1 Tax=Camellia sinensis TaxID=4442 RepID=A0A7J7GQJ8_CAMSI|nr:hypothetical protein HYC85_019346 [Camellia sinensis]